MFQKVQKIECLSKNQAPITRAENGFTAAQRRIIKAKIDSEKLRYFEAANNCAFFQVQKIQKMRGAITRPLKIGFLTGVSRTGSIPSHVGRGPGVFAVSRGSRVLGAIKRPDNYYKWVKMNHVNIFKNVYVTKINFPVR